MGECNYCTLRRIKKKAWNKKQRVTKLTGFMGGIEVFVHPPDVVIEVGAKEEHHPQHKYWVCWLMAIGDHCTC